MSMSSDHQQTSVVMDAAALTSSLMPTLFYGLVIVVLLVKYKRQRDEVDAHKLVTKLEQHNLKALPKPPQMPIIGHLHLMRDYQQNPWDGFNAIRQQYGNIVSLQMGVHSMVLISSVEHMNEVLIKKGHIFADRPHFPRHNIVFGGDRENSLALCNWSNTHRARRKFCKRGVVPNKLSARNQLLEKIISETLRGFVGDLSRGKDAAQDDDESGDNHRNLTKNDLLFLTGDIFLKFLCNERCSHRDANYQRFNIGCDFIFYDINQCYLLDFMPYLTSFGFGYSYLRQLKGITDYCRYYIDDNIFEPRRMRHLQRRLDSNENNDGARLSEEQPTLHLDQSLLDLKPEQQRVLQDSQEDQHKPLEEEDDDYLDSIIKEQILGITSMSLDDYKVGFADLLAGHAAVTNILMRLLGHLSLDDAMQDMIYEEARRARLDSLDQAPPLPVAEASLQEALRLASSPIVPHVAREDTSIGDYYVPKGSSVLFNCYNVNLSPSLWSKPREYNPRRFLESSLNEAGETSHKLNLPKFFMPFSVGQRQCLGYKMVESIAVLAVASICLRYKIKPNDEELVKKLLEPKGSIALNPMCECFELKLYTR